MEQENEKNLKVGSLEGTDQAESMRQLWWTLGVTAVALGFIAYYTL